MEGLCQDGGEKGKDVLCLSRQDSIESGLLICIYLVVLFYNLERDNAQYTVAVMLFTILTLYQSIGAAFIGYIFKKLILSQQP